MKKQSDKSWSWWVLYVVLSIICFMAAVFIVNSLYSGISEKQHSKEYKLIESMMKQNK